MVEVICIHSQMLCVASAYSTHHLLGPSGSQDDIIQSKPWHRMGSDVKDTHGLFLNDQIE